MIATEQPFSRLDGLPVAPSRARTVLALSPVEGRGLIRHPVIVAAAVLAITQTILMLLANDFRDEDTLGWLLQVSALFVGFGALIAANLQALKSRRDGSEEVFGAAPMTPGDRTLALGLGAVWVMGAVILFLLAGDLAIRGTGNKAATDSGQALFPMFDLVQAPAVAGLFVLVGIALARWLPRALAGPVAVVALFVLGNWVLNALARPWFRLTPFDPTFLEDGAVLAAIHAVYLGALAMVALAAALLRSAPMPWARAWLAGGAVLSLLTGGLQVAS